MLLRGRTPLSGRGLIILSSLHEHELCGILPCGFPAHLCRFALHCPAHYCSGEPVRSVPKHLQRPQWQHSHARGAVYGGAARPCIPPRRSFSPLSLPSSSSWVRAPHSLLTWSHIRCARVQDDQDDKRLRRKQSNRESARRSRLRKQARLGRAQGLCPFHPESLWLCWCPHTCTVPWCHASASALSPTVCVSSRVALTLTSGVPCYHDAAQQQAECEELGGKIGSLGGDNERLKRDLAAANQACSNLREENRLLRARSRAPPGPPLPPSRAALSCPPELPA